MVKQRHRTGFVGQLSASASEPDHFITVSGSGLICMRGCHSGSSMKPQEGTAVTWKPVTCTSGGPQMSKGWDCLAVSVSRGLSTWFVQHDSCRAAGLLTRRVSVSKAHDPRKRVPSGQYIPFDEPALEVTQQHFHHFHPPGSPKGTPRFRKDEVDSGASPVAPRYKESTCTIADLQETRVRPLGREDPLEEETATHSSILAWRILWAEDLVGHSPWGHKS